MRKVDKDIFSELSEDDLKLSSSEPLFLSATQQFYKKFLDDDGFTHLLTFDISAYDCEKDQKAFRKWFGKVTMLFRMLQHAYFPHSMFQVSYSNTPNDKSMEWIEKYGLPKEVEIVDEEGRLVEPLLDEGLSYQRPFSNMYITPIIFKLAIKAPKRVSDMVYAFDYLSLLRTSLYGLPKNAAGLQLIPKKAIIDAYKTKERCDWQQIAHSLYSVIKDLAEGHKAFLNEDDSIEIHSSSIIFLSHCNDVKDMFISRGLFTDMPNNDLFKQICLSYIRFMKRYRNYDVFGRFFTYNKS